MDTSKSFEVRDLYDQTSEKYDERYKKIQFSKFSEALHGSFLEGLVLDAGCGTGLFLEYVEKERHGLIVGLDLSFNMLLVAKKKTDTSLLVAGDLQFLPFRKRVFDRVYSFSVLQNLACDRCGLGELFRVSKSGAKLVITALNKKYSFYDLDNLVREICLEKNLSCEWEALFLSMEDIGVFISLNSY